MTQGVSAGGKIVIAFGAFLMVGAAFIVSSPLIAIVVFIMGIVALVLGYGMKSIQQQPQQQEPTYKSNGQHYKTGLGIPKKDPKNKGAI